MIRIRSALTVRHNALAAVGVTVALGLAVALAHGAPGQDHMAGVTGTDDPHSGRSVAVTVCFAVLEAGAAGAVLLTGRLLVRHGLVRAARDLGRELFASANAVERPVPGARAGPALLQVFRL